MRFCVLGALLFLASPAAADEMPVGDAIVQEGVVVPHAFSNRAKRAVVRRVVCIKCRSAGLPWGGLRPVRKAQLPWGGLPDYCPPAGSRTVVLVTKG